MLTTVHCYPSKIHSSKTNQVFNRINTDNDQLIRVIEEKIRVKTISMGLRVTEFFHDFDRLRSGFVTRSQFKRCLDTNLRLQLTNEEESLLFYKYDIKRDGNICYRQFCDVINRKYPESELTSNPELLTNEAPPYLNSWRSTRHVSSQDQTRQLNELLNKISIYSKQRGIDVLTTMEQFDKHQMGEITESQFYRSFVGPNLNEYEMTLLRDKYSDPHKPGMINYLNFVQDLKNLSQSTNSNLTESTNSSTLIGVEEQSEQRSVQEILDRIRVSTYKYGIRLSDFFKDYDKLRSGYVTDRQFSTVLSLSVEKQSSLNRNDIDKLTEYYRQADGRIFYREFAESMDNSFNVVELEKKPLIEVHRPRQGILSRPLNSNLSPDEEERVQILLEKIKIDVHNRRLILFPFFKIFDRSKAFTRLCTKHQFGRVLRTVDLIPSPFDFNILCKKFEDRLSGDINYALFCQIVEQDFTAIKIDDEIEQNYGQARSIKSTNQISSIDVVPSNSKENFNDLMGRIRHHVLINRIRVKEFFEDFDPLRLGTITKSRFIRVLSSLGLTGLDGLPLNIKQFQLLIDQYQHPTEKDLVLWKQFEIDLESVFTLSDLDKKSSIEVSPQSIYEMVNPGTADLQQINPFNKQEFEQTINNWKSSCQQRRIEILQTFQQFDRHNRGHVTQNQFRQCLSIVGLDSTEKQFQSVESVFMDDQGFNYRPFIEIVQPLIHDHLRYDDLQNDLTKLNSKKLLEELEPLNSIQDVLQKVKGQVFRRRIRLYEWLKDHDKLNCGRLQIETFRRAINPCQLELKEKEVSLLEDYYRSRSDSNSIDYKRFCEEIESIFTNDQLEKNPLSICEQYQTIKESSMTKLDPDEEDQVEQVLKKISNRVHQRRIQLFPKFEDFDRVKNGYVTEKQFIRVLDDLSLLSLINGIEKSSLFKKFRVQVGGRQDIDYLSFCHRVNLDAGFDKGTA